MNTHTFDEADPDRCPAATATLTQALGLLASIEHHSTHLGATAALPFIGLARWELEDALPASASMASLKDVPVSDLHDGLAQLSDLMDVATTARTSLLLRLCLERSRSLMRDAAHAARVEGDLDRGDVGWVHHLPQARQELTP
jgi:hypothetical protein